MSVLRRSILVAATGVTLLGAAATPAAAQSPEGTIRSAGGATAVTGSYLVVFKDDAVSAHRVPGIARVLAGRHNGTVARSYQTALRGFQFRGSERMAKRVAADPAVAYVEQDHQVRIAGEQPNPPSWGLDRVNQRVLPLDGSYTYPRQGATVTAYVLDTGIRYSHQEFGGRAVSGYDTVDYDNDAEDCNGHGTHVAGTIGGSSYGVAKSVRLVGVRVLNCSGSGNWASVIAGIDWIAANASRPAVVNMSLGGSAVQAVDDAVRNSIRSGITYGLAAGNSGQDACSYTPARVTEAITIGATDRYDRAAGFSNYGTCVDILAPGVDIGSAWYTGDQATVVISGTSMATPHVVGAAALLLDGQPTLTPQQVRDRLLTDATSGRLLNLRTGTPNELLYVSSLRPLPPTKNIGGWPRQLVATRSMTR